MIASLHVTLSSKMAQKGQRSAILDLLAQIEEKHFGASGQDLDQGEDVSDSDLLDGFMDAYLEASSAEISEGKYILMTLNKV